MDVNMDDCENGGFKHGVLCHVLQYQSCFCVKRRFSQLLSFFVRSEKIHYNYIIFVCFNFSGMQTRYNIAGTVVLNIFATQHRFMLCCCYGSFVTPFPSLFFALSCFQILTKSRGTSSDHSLSTERMVSLNKDIEVEYLLLRPVRHYVEEHKCTTEPYIF